MYEVDYSLESRPRRRTGMLTNEEDEEDDYDTLMMMQCFNLEHEGEHSTHQIIRNELRPRSSHLRQALGIEARQRARGQHIAEQASRRAIRARR